MSSVTSTTTPGTNLPPDTRLHGGAYTVGAVLGQGGCGITYEGIEINLRRPVAIKEFFPPGASRMGAHVLRGSDFSASLEQFMEEARALAGFSHPNIVKVWTVFEENNTAYMVMELLKGKNLEQVVEESGPLPEPEALAIIAQIVEALTVVHKTGFIHRDIKPANAIRCDDGRVVLIDFGLNKKLEVARLHHTRQLDLTTATGTEGYSPPEQYLKSSIQGIATDIYALGATLYFLLTRKVPVSAPERAMGAALPTPAQLNSRVSDNVSKGILRAMALKETERFSTVRELLEHLRTGVPTTVLPPPIPQTAPASYQPAPAPSPPTAAPVQFPKPAAPSNWLPVPPQSSRCQRCGSVNPKTATHCQACNTQLTGSGQPLKITEPPVMSSSCMLFILGFLILVFYIWAFHT